MLTCFSNNSRTEYETLGTMEIRRLDQQEQDGGVENNKYILGIEMNDVAQSTLYQAKKKPTDQKVAEQALPSLEKMRNLRREDFKRISGLVQSLGKSPERTAMVIHLSKLGLEYQSNSARLIAAYQKDDPASIDTQAKVEAHTKEVREQALLALHMLRGDGAATKVDMYWKPDASRISSVPKAITGSTVEKLVFGRPGSLSARSAGDASDAKESESAGDDDTDDSVREFRLPARAGDFDDVKYTDLQTLTDMKEQDGDIEDL